MRVTAARPVPHDGAGKGFIIQLDRLEPSTTEAELSAALLHPPLNINLSHKDDHEYGDIAQHIRRLCEGKKYAEHQGQWQLGTARYSLRLQFEDIETAKWAVKTFDKIHIPEIDGVTIYAQRTYSFTAPILSQVMELLWDYIEDLARKRDDFKKVRVARNMPRAANKPHSTTKTVVLQAFGEDLKILANVKDVLTKIVEGDIVYDHGGGYLWHDSFAKDEGFRYLNQLGRDHQAFILRDVDRKRLRVIGRPCNIKQVPNRLRHKVQSLTTDKRVVKLDSAQRRAASKKGGFERIKKAFSDRKITYDFSRSSTSNITFWGSEEELKQAERLLLQPDSVEN
ncbi:hypothetical protein LTS18_012325, partial [Coniosporium uncinatum]